ncbi:MAG: 2-oxoglutarate dehydrogenase E1 component [Bdellovibrio sp.]|nr:2-oxoglutarate dehydrogenase E1 component [Bdellovibrio sp.]
MSDVLSYISPRYLEFMHGKFLQGPGAALPPTWTAFFEGHKIAQSEIEGRILHELYLKALIDEFRINGHKCANIDLFEEKAERCQLHEKLNGFDDNTKYLAPGFAGLNFPTTKDLKSYLRTMFTGNIGIEFAHILDIEVRQWLENKLNPKNITQIDPNKKIKWLQLLIKTTKLEEFLQDKYPGKKRFSLEGAEGLTCALHELAEIAIDYGVEEIGLAMAHRGRVNVLANFLNLSLINLFAEFEELKRDQAAFVQGDVKYHLGHTNKIKVKGKDLNISLAFNPSHLEFVYPVLLGKVRAKIMSKYNSKWGAILPVIIHGDAAFVGQGIVTETLNFSELKPYAVGGSVHIILNNQLGFTATSSESRSSIYCSDFAKALEAPIFHVNCFDVEAICTITKLAFEFRQKFLRDIFIEICCYRKYGHNEIDEPRYTNPRMYNQIQKFRPVSEIYKDKLVNQNIIGQKEIDDFNKAYINHLEDKRQEVQTKSVRLSDNSFQGEWVSYKPPTFERMISLLQTPISAFLFENIIEVIHKDIPPEIHILPKLSRALARRYEKYKSTKEVIWSLAELISFASLLSEGYSIRLVGQDSVRGTFSQRHITYLDQDTEQGYIPLKKFENDSLLEIYNSPLSENATLGFEFGYSLSTPKCLTIWEAQYGDFSNSAQVIIDQFIVSSEFKWKRASGLVLLLPHGYEGQGPDHSSARIERFLQLAGQLNIQITQPSTAAQYFHLLRRQMHQDFRKPLIIFTPKSMLRSDLNSSPIGNFISGGFVNIISSESNGGEKVGLVCSGKIFWDVYSEAKKRELLENIMFVRIEQLYPLDINKLKGVVEENKRIQHWIWVQEEPQNAGGWFFIKLNTLSLNWKLKYVGRPVSAVTAEGNYAVHDDNQREIINQALRSAR